MRGGPASARRRLALGVVTLLAGVVLPASSSGSFPVGTEHPEGLRPGSPILPDDWLTVQTLHGEPRVTFCTANFVFADAAGDRYIGTAGHCAPVERGIHAWASGAGPVALDGDYQRIGTFVYAGSTLVPTEIPAPAVGLRPEWDLALILLDPGVPVDAQMAHFGGPTGLNEDLTSLPVVLHHYGWGVHGVNGEPEVEDCCAVEQPFHARTGVAPSMARPDLVHYFAVEGGGDSGGPVISADGRAVGVVSSMNYAGHGASADGLQTGNSVAVRLGPQVAKAQEVLGVELTLQTAPLSP